MDIYPAAAELIRDVPVEKPALCFRPRAAVCAAWRLGNPIPGKMLYAVTANRSPAALRILMDAGSRGVCPRPWLN